MLGPGDRVRYNVTLPEEHTVQSERQASMQAPDAGLGCSRDTGNPGELGVKWLTGAGGQDLSNSITGAGCLIWVLKDE